MLFQSYPFCLAEDRKDPERLQKVLMRTLECEFSFPDDASVSAECKDLIRRMLTHSKKRITVEEITQHPWFTKGLPQGALDMNQSLTLRKGTRVQVNPLCPCSFEFFVQSKMDIVRILEEASLP